MPKMKTKSGLKKRVKVTASGRVKVKPLGLRHILTKKKSKNNRQKRRKAMVTDTQAATIKTMLHN